MSREGRIQAGFLMLLVISWMIGSPTLRWEIRLAHLKMAGALPSKTWIDLILDLAPWRTRAPSYFRERVTPGEFNDSIEMEHLARYEFARDFCVRKRVADIACGTGYGMHILAETAASVDGYDRELLCGNYVIDLDKESWTRQYDVIVSFETIEHLKRPDFFLQNVRKTAQLLILSAPVTETTGQNPFHKQVWNLSEIKELLEKSFTCVYYSQIGDSIYQDAEGPRQYLLAVCTTRP